jgi:hypothetical protein
MKRVLTLVLVVVATLLAWHGTAHAQTVTAAQATPTPDPMVYTDPGMHFRAPAGFLPVGQRHVDPSALGEQPTVLAGWVYPSSENPRRLLLTAQAFDGSSVDNWDSQFEQLMRGQSNNALFRDKEHFAFRNGMPAMFMTMTTGEGFSAQKLFCVIWADGTRGMALILTSQIGDISIATAKQMLSDVTAVRYPIDQP